MKSALLLLLSLVTLAQSPAPSSLPLLTKDAFTYMGGFRLPRAAAGGDTFEFGESAMAHNPATNTLYYASRKNNVAEVSIPTPVNSSTITNLPFASYQQPFSDVMEGHLKEIPGSALRAIAVLGGRLCGTAMVFYDATNSQRFSHFCHSLTLAEPSFSGWSAVWQANKTGMVAGWMAPLPAEWHGLGGDALTGNCCVPVVTRTSYGMAAFAFSAAAIGTPLVPASPLLYYPGEHTTLGPWSGSNGTYGGTTSVNGMVVIAGTRTVMYAGRNGIGLFCYGPGLADPTDPRIGTSDGLPTSEKWCFDPTSADKGQHAWPYIKQAWLYDLNDFAAVKAGTKQPWEVVPYAVFPIELPTPDRGNMGGLTYDADRKVLYASQLRADQDGFASRPLIHAFSVAIPTPPPTTTEPPPPPPPPPPPDPPVDPELQKIEEALEDARQRLTLLERLRLQLTAAIIALEAMLKK